MYAEELLAKIRDRHVVVGVVGLGYVGLPLLRTFWDAGLRVLGFDVAPEKIRMLRQGHSYLQHLGQDFVSVMASSERFEVTSDPRLLARADALLVCVPTPLDAHLQPDLSFVEATADTIAEVLRPGQLVVLESTTYPGTTRDLFVPRLEQHGLVTNQDVFVAFSPEREDPGRKTHATKDIPKVVGGISPTSSRLAVSLYRLGFTEVVPVSSCEVAESAKLLENIYRAVNIALVNEMKLVLSGLGIDIWEVIDAAATKPFGFQAFYPGPGLGGHCIPIDPFYLTWKAKEVGITTRFIELAGQVNHMMPEFVVQRTILALNERGQPVKDARILVLGLAYKPDVDDYRESPSFELIDRLQNLGAKVDYNDPHVPETKPTRHHDLGLTSVPLTPETLGAYDCVVIATHHQAYDWEMIGASSRLIIDTRGALRRLPLPAGRVVNA